MSDLFKSHTARPRPAASPVSSVPVGTATDPVCHMSVKVDGAKHTAEYQGETYYFCCAGCRTKFLDEPARYLAPATTKAESDGFCCGTCGGDGSPASVAAAAAASVAARASSEAARASSATDPVCGMSVTIDGAKHTAEHQGKTYYFCHPGCRTKFIADPARYLVPAAERPPAPPADPDAWYICPMDPEIRQIGPGTCPICGMALEPEAVSLTSGPNPELVDMRRRLWIGALLTAPVVALEMGGHLLGLAHLVPAHVSKLIQLVLATPVVALVGWPFIERGWMSLVTRNFNMFTLIALGTLTALAYSIVATLLPGAFPPVLRAQPGGVPVYFEAAAVITVLVVVGQVLELRARDQTGDAIRALLRLAPETATRVRDGAADETVPLDQVAPGDRLRVRPGDSVPLDGVVLDGETTVDQSMVTGEAMPVEKGPGDAVVGGTVNGSGAFVMRADKVGRDTLLARIVQLVSEAQRSRAPVQRLADQVAGWFVPLVVLAALLAFLAWWVFGPEPRLAFALVAAVSVLVIACPCALGLATPMSIMVGLGRGAEAGVLFRSADALERLEKADTLVVDKTGTLTEGKPAVVAVLPLGHVSESELLRLAASAERASEHPLAKAVVTAATARGLALAEPRDAVATAGKGVRATVDGRRIAIGSRRHLAAEAQDAAALDPLFAKLSGAETAIAVAIDGRAAGIVTLADRIKDTAPAALAALRDAGIRVVMLTGDNPAVAHAVAAKLGIAEVEAEVLPEDKARVVARLKSEGRVVAMAGDGINDAPALAAADVGIAMGTGSGVAIETAGVTLVGGDLGGIARARKLSRATMRNIRQNLVFAFGYNAMGVPIAAGVLYPVLGILLSPIVAAAAMSLSSVSVIGNALRLGRMRL